MLPSAGKFTKNPYSFVREFATLVVFDQSILSPIFCGESMPFTRFALATAIALSATAFTLRAATDTETGANGGVGTTGSDGNPGQTGGPGSPGQPANADAGFTIPNTDTSKIATATGGNGVGTNASGGNGGNGGNGGDATARASTSANLDIPGIMGATANATAGSGGAGGGGGSANGSGTLGASGSSGVAGNASAFASATNAGTSEAP